MLLPWTLASFGGDGVVMKLAYSTYGKIDLLAVGKHSAGRACIRVTGSCFRAWCMLVRIVG